MARHGSFDDWPKASSISTTSSRERTNWQSSLAQPLTSMASMRTNVVAVGYSNGANIASSMMLLRPGTLAGGVLLRPMVPLEPETPPDLSGTPVYLGAGRMDPIVPVENVEQLAELLRGYGADVMLTWQPTGHGLTREDVLSARDWLAGSGHCRFVSCLTRGAC